MDFVEPLDKDQKKKPKKRLSRRYAMTWQSFLGTQGVKVERNYHHARAGDRRKGRALENDGNLFTYEAIQANQSFQGAVLGSKVDLEKLQEWLKEVDSIGIGRSRSAQYGEAELEWMDIEPIELINLVEWNGFLPQQAPSQSRQVSHHHHIISVVECQRPRTPRSTFSNIRVGKYFRRGCCLINTLTRLYPF